MREDEGVEKLPTTISIEIRHAPFILIHKRIPDVFD